MYRHRLYGRAIFSKTGDSPLSTRLQHSHNSNKINWPAQDMRSVPILLFIWSFLLLFSAEHMLRRGISAGRICLLRVDLLPLIFAKMCQSCLLFLPARFLLDFCSFARFLLTVCSTCALQRSWPWFVVWHGVHNFTASCVWCFLGAVLYILCS